MPKPYWKITAEAEILNSVVEAEYEKKRIETSVEADAIVQSCVNKTGEIVKIDYKTFIKTLPFHLTLVHYNGKPTISSGTLPGTP